MFSYILLIFVALLSPLSLDWNNKHTIPPEIKSYKYYFGDTAWGLVVYLGEDLDEMETELQLMYTATHLSSALLVLGPIGLNNINCLKKYKSIVGVLNKKYGHFKHRRETKDPLIEELLLSGFCNSTRTGLYEVHTFWRKGRFGIEAVLVGDEEGIYIHITYSNLKFVHLHKKQERKKILKRL